MCLNKIIVCAPGCMRLHPLVCLRLSPVSGACACVRFHRCYNQLMLKLKNVMLLRFYFPCQYSGPQIIRTQERIKIYVESVKILIVVSSN